MRNIFMWIFTSVILLIEFSNGFRGVNNPNLKLMQDYIKQLEESIHKLDGNQAITRFGQAGFYLNNSSEAAEKRAQFLNNIMIPGRSGSYATSNSFYLYGKLISTAMSVSFVPVQNINIPPSLIPPNNIRPPFDSPPSRYPTLPPSNQKPIAPPTPTLTPTITPKPKPRPILPTTTISPPDIDYDISPFPRPQPTIPPVTRPGLDYDDSSVQTTQVPNNKRKVINHPFYNPYFLQYYPHFYIPPFNFLPQRIRDPKGVPIDRYGPESRFG